MMAMRRKNLRPDAENLDMAPAFRHLSDELGRRVLRAQQCGSYVSPSTRWYCWQSHPGAEFLALLELNRQGFATHLPLFCDRQRHALRRGGRVTASPPPILPLFPGYGFVAFDIGADRWRAVASTRGVKRLFGSAPERPSPVPRGMVEKLIGEQGPDGYRDDGRAAARLPSIPTGAAVRITEGPFEGFVGICGLSADRRVQVLLDVMGSRSQLSLARGAVEQLENAVNG